MCVPVIIKFWNRGVEDDTTNCWRDLTVIKCKQLAKQQTYNILHSLFLNIRRFQFNLNCQNVLHLETDVVLVSCDQISGEVWTREGKWSPYLANKSSQRKGRENPSTFSVKQLARSPAHPAFPCASPQSKKEKGTATHTQRKAAGEYYQKSALTRTCQCSRLSSYWHFPEKKRRVNLRRPFCSADRSCNFHFSLFLSSS